MKLQYRTALQFFLFGATTLLILLWTFERHNKKVLTREALVNIETLAKESSQHIDTHLEEKAAIALTLSSAPIIREALLKSNEEFGELKKEARREQIEFLNKQWIETKDINSTFIQRYLNNPVAGFLRKQDDLLSGTYGEIFLTNRYGLAIATTNKLTTLAHKHKYWWAASHNKGDGRIFLDDRGFDKSVRGYVLGIVVPVLEEKKVIGILKCNFNILGPISHVVKSFNNDHLALLKIARSEGIIVFEEGRDPLSSLLQESLVESILQRRRASATIDISGAEMLVAHRAIPITSGSDQYGFGGSYESLDHIMGNRGERWNAVVFLDKEHVLAKAQETTRMLLFLGILLVIIMAVLAIFLGRKIAQPLRELMESAEQVGEGRLETRIEVSSRDEIGALAKSFNSMVVNLKRTMATRDELSREIEQRKAAEGYVHIFRQLLEQSTDGIFLVDAVSAHFLDVNTEACANLGYSRDELLKMRVVDIEAKLPDDFSWSEHTKMLRKERTMVFDGVHRRKDGTTYPVEVGIKVTHYDGKEYMIAIARNMTERKKSEEERERLIEDLQEALTKVKLLSGFLPICASCKKIRDDKGYWNQIECYIRDHSEADFSHSICPECSKKLYSELDEEEEKNGPQ